MTQRNDVLDIKQESPLTAKESPLSYEPRILRNPKVKKCLYKELSMSPEIKPKINLQGKK